ncbi:MAG: hypothetical protein K2P85_05235 [Flavobacteriaceae bacterium]|nr:hypothetical protein [Flavobacteriaceae bacterium]
MRKIIILLLLTSSICFAQKDIDSLKISDLEVPNAPALTLLDKSFSLVEASNSSNAINANLVNIKDNAIEVVPYWLLNENKFTSSNAYYGFTADEKGVITKQNVFNDFIKKTSFSLAYTTTDTLSSIAFGLRSNIIAVKNIKRINELFTNQKNYTKEREKYIDSCKVTTLNKMKSKPDVSAIIATLEKNDDKTKLAEYLIELDTQARNNLMDEYDKNNKKKFDALAKDFNKHFNHKVFTWDFATGATLNFPGNESNYSRLGRYGVWSTAKYSLFISEDDFFNIYGFGRLLKDETQIDPTTLKYLKNEYVDIGGKVEFQFKKISISGEYINRNGDGKDHRLVGVIQYKVMDNLFISGGYGKNFETDSGNLLTLFGLKWGLSEKPVVKFN